MILVGILLLSGLGLVALEGVGYARGGYSAAFWRLPLDDKLDHIGEHVRDWWWISIWSLVGVFTVTGGVAGLAYLLADAGEPVLSYVAFGGYLIAAVAWVFGLSVQSAGVSSAAAQRADTGETPEWLRPLWNIAYVAEGTWVIGSNVAYALLGAAVVQTGLIAAWAGWMAIVGGLLIVVGVLIAKDGFPQLAALVPALIGIALLIEGM